MFLCKCCTSKIEVTEIPNQTITSHDTHNPRGSHRGSLSSSGRPRSRPSRRERKKDQKKEAPPERQAQDQSHPTQAAKAGQATPSPNVKDQDQDSGSCQDRNGTCLSPTLRDKLKSLENPAISNQPWR